ncbi:MAG: hypothetical protein GY757_14950 [bacterium]|nr:hypothetical protein [bacterium]
MEKMKIAIVGIGLIGGSMAAGMKKFIPGCEIHGVDFPDTLKKAKALNYIDCAVEKIEDLPNDIDILFLGAPIDTNKELLRKVVSAKQWHNRLIDIG